MTRRLDGAERLIVVVGPSGAGKDSVIAAWLASLPSTLRPHRVRRSITRPADAHEDHEPLDALAFARAAAAGAFAFQWQAHGLCYGIRHAELAALATGRWVVMNGSRAHLPHLQAVAPRARVVEIDAPVALRQARLQGRAREAEAGRAARLARDVELAPGAVRIVNAGRLEDAVKALDGWWRCVASAQAPALPEPHARQPVDFSRPSSAGPA